MKTALYFTVSVCFFVSSSQAEDRTPSPIGKKIENFTLKDYRGKQVSLADYKEKKLVVVAFLGAECPLAKLYAPALAKMAKEYESKGVTFLGINANRQDSITEIASYAERHGVRFPMLKDVGNVVADRMGALRTPEVFLLDEQRKVRYWGRVDNKYGVGYIRDNATREDLRIAIDELLAGKKVSILITESDGCHIGRIKKPVANAKITFSKHVAPILNKRCVECHRKSEIAPFELIDYDEVAGWAEMIKEVVKENRMPPWHASPKHGKFSNDRRLTKEEKETIYAWVKAGAPQGNPKDLPKLPAKKVAKWQLSKKPDAVFTMKKTPFTVPAEAGFTSSGERRGIPYRYFVVDPGFKENKWITAAEVLPGNRAVVHHILVIVRPPEGAKAIGAGGGEFLVGYVPGLRAKRFPKGSAKLISAGSKLVFQVHYTPIGTEQTDLSKVGLIFGDPKKIKDVVVTTNAVKRRFVIPPHAENHRVEATTRAMPSDVKLLSFMPHMHLRGKSFSYEANYPDGTKEMLLEVPQYDFNWQTSYELLKEKTLPRGTRIHCVAHFDNSEKNLANPDPKKTIRWGDQTWEEMMIGYFDIVIPRSVVESNLKRAKANPDRPNGDGTLRANALLKRLDADKNGSVSREEVPDRWARLFDRLDKNKDDKLNAEELKAALRNRRR